MYFSCLEFGLKRLYDRNRQLGIAFIPDIDLGDSPHSQVIESTNSAPARAITLLRLDNDVMSLARCLILLLIETELPAITLVV